MLILQTVHHPLSSSNSSCPSLSCTSISPVEKCDFLNLTFLCPALPECNSVMRYSIETSNRLMVHLAGLINSCVEVEKASGSVEGVVSLWQRLWITFWSIDHFTSMFGAPGSSIDTVHIDPGQLWYWQRAHVIQFNKSLMENLMKLFTALLS